MRFSGLETVTCWERRRAGPGIIIAHRNKLLSSLDSGLMAKDKSEKKKKQVSEDVPPAAEEDVEMTETKVSNNHSCLEDAK